MGVAAIFLGALLAATFWFPRRGVTVTLTALGVAIAASAAAVLALPESRALPPPSVDLGKPVVWVRSIAAFMVGAIGLAVLLSFVLRAWERALEGSMLARERERVALEKQKRTAEAFARAQRLEAIGRLAGGVAHDFNNALTVIITSAEMAKRAQDDHRRRLLIDDILEASRGAAATATQLLAFNRRGVQTDQQADPADVVERMAATLRRWLPESIHVEVSSEPTPRVPLSPEQLEQVLLNLAINARDAMPHGGNMRLRVRAPSALDERVLVEVEDEGTGMDSETVPHVFEPFFTTKEDGQGSGLGLSMVHGTVTAVGGSVDIWSEPDVGTRIRLAFPPARAEAAPPPPVMSGRGSGGTVLLVEDQEEVRDVIARTLEEEGYDVLAASDVAGALHALRRGGRFDLLLTDGVMPGRPTHELIDIFERSYPDVPVIVCSGHVDDELVRQGIETGRFEVLPKPFGVDELRVKVRSLMKGRCRAS